jgi:hypothetical protein
MTSPYELKTRSIIHMLLTRIMQASDSYQKHKKLKYKPFLGIQLKLLKQIIATESDIRAQKKAQNHEMLEQARDRRRLLKELGSAVAWVLLEYNQPYIRAFSHNLEPGFISGKEGLRLEEIALRASFGLENYAGVLHDITNCLRIGDLSVRHPDGWIQTLELKSVKNPEKKGTGDHRQKVRGRNIRDYYDTGRSTRVLPGWTIVRHRFKKHGRHNWRQLRKVISKAERSGIATTVTGKCVTYIAFRADVKDAVLQRTMKNVTIRFKKPSDTVVGFLSERFEVPWVLPVPCFELPLNYKEWLLFADVGICVIVDLRRLAETFTRHGLPSKAIRDRRTGFLKTKLHGVSEPTVLGEGLLARLLYELVSVDTIIEYTRELTQKVKDLALQKKTV